MDKPILTFVKFLIACGITGMLYYIWDIHRPFDSLTIKVGASLMGGVVSFLFLYFGGKN